MKTIYFAHDRQENPAVRLNFLEMAGYRVVAMKSGHELVDALRREAPDLLLMDALLAGPNGFQVCLAISQQVVPRTFPIILCSGIYRTRAFREEALRCGAQDYFLLPIPLDEFGHRVQRALQDFKPIDEPWRYEDAA
jgi:CheY-like chemotaxis protein